jgi:hypothetical protein
MKHTLNFAVKAASGAQYSCPIEAKMPFFHELADEVEPTQAGISLTLNCLSKLAGFLSRNSTPDESALLEVTFDGVAVVTRRLKSRDFFNRFTLVHRSGLVAQSIASYLDEHITEE